jgi:signal recognition particle subunit SRP19
MPTVEDYNEEDDFVFDDDTDLPLPGSSSSKPAQKRNLKGEGDRGALLSHIDDDQVDFDLAKLADQGRGVEGKGAPTYVPGSSSVAAGKARDDGSNRPSAPGPGGLPGMGGIMGDLMKIQAAEDERMKKLEKQLGNTRFAKDPSEFKR